MQQSVTNFEKCFFVSPFSRKLRFVNLLTKLKSIREKRQKRNLNLTSQVQKEICRIKIDLKRLRKENVLLFVLQNRVTTAL